MARKLAQRAPAGRSACAAPHGAARDAASDGVAGARARSQRVAYILTLGVLEPFRREGVAAALLARAAARPGPHA